jgi:putative oxidoreductase
MRENRDDPVSSRLPQGWCKGFAAPAPPAEFCGKSSDMAKITTWLLDPPIFGPRAILWIRLVTGGIFFWEGLLKFVYPNQGAGRFTALGFPLPEFTAHFVAISEIFGGVLLLLGMFTRIAALYFIAEMIVAILSTKISVFLGTSPLPLPPSPPKTGFWAVLHEIRVDYAMLFTSVFLLLEGPGVLSLDRLRRGRFAPWKNRVSPALR